MFGKAINCLYKGLNIKTRLYYKIAIFHFLGEGVTEAIFVFRAVSNFRVRGRAFIVGDSHGLHAIRLSCMLTPVMYNVSLKSDALKIYVFVREETRKNI